MKKFVLLFVIVCTSLTAFSQNNECVTDSSVYAAGESWYINNEPIDYMGKKYVKYGLPRVLSLGEVTAAKKYKRTTVFVETGSSDETREVLYIPVRKGCEFQPYVLSLPPCNIKVKITHTVKTATSGKTYVFTANTTTPYKKLSYAWYITITKEDGDEIEEPDSYIVGSPYAKNLVVKTKGLLKNAVITALLTVGNDEADCQSLDVEATAKVQ